MATVTSRVPALIDYLVALFTNAATLGQGTPKVTVYDGPVVTADPEPLVLWVGLSDPAIPSAGADSVQDWASLGRRARSELITVHCCAVAWGGAGTFSVRRVAAFGIVAAVEALMQADTTQFGGNILMPKPGLTAVALTQMFSDRGPVCRVAFDLIFESRIGGF